MRDNSRNVGALYAFDSWTIAPSVRVGYGARYARYDYLADRGLWSPRASIAVKPSERDSLTFRATASHREVAPGAEEFLPSSIGPWLPPQRTFTHVSHAAFRPERHDQVELAVERKWPGSILVGVQGVPPARRRSGRHALRSRARRRAGRHRALSGRLCR